MATPATRTIRRWASVTLLGLLAACGGALEGPSDPNDPSAAEAALTAQHLANLRLIDAYRRDSEAKYDSLLAVWRARGTPGIMRAVGTGETFVACAPLPFDAEAQVVGPAGGQFVFGPHRLTVPPGALAANTSIGVVVTSALKSEVVLLPHGIQFAVPVTLSLAYGHCEPAAAPRVAYIDDDDAVLEWVPAQNLPGTTVLDAVLHHFSKYAVAY